MSRYIHNTSSDPGLLLPHDVFHPVYTDTPEKLFSVFSQMFYEYKHGTLLRMYIRVTIYEASMLDAARFAYFVDNQSIRCMLPSRMVINDEKEFI